MIVNIHDTKSEKAMAPHSSTLAWKIPWTEEPGRLQFMGSWRVLKSDFPFTFHFHALEKEMATHSSVLAWRIPGMGEPGGLPSTGSHRVRHDWSNLAAAWHKVVWSKWRMSSSDQVSRVFRRRQGCQRLPAEDARQTECSVNVQTIRMEI